MSDFKVPEGATHFVNETDDFRAHFIQVDDATNVLAEFVPSVNYIGWDFDIEPYPMLADSIPVSAYKELTTLRQQNAEVRDKLTTITKQRDELVALLDSAGKELYMLINEVNKLRMMQVNSTTETPPDLHDMETCHVIGRMLSTIKEQKDEN